MKNIKSLVFIGLISSMSLILNACSDDADEPTSKKETTGDHVWKTQTDALQSAKDMAKEMQKSLDQQQEKMNENK